MISIIIPVGPDDKSWIKLLNDLQKLPNKYEFIFVATSQLIDEDAIIFENFRKSKNENVDWIISNPSRACQLNKGAKLAKYKKLWFLHCDSQFFFPHILKALIQFENSDLSHIYFFDLVFMNDGPFAVLINQLGANIRSRLLKMPFGDQGLMMSKEIYYRCGEFDESLKYGEDHLFVWKARLMGFEIKPIGAALGTSAKKYSENGWLNQTIKTGYLTFIQSIPPALNLITKKVGIK